ncbi:unnamed protein product [Phytophthora fragariaefolia]|uniref:Unnamed protein product n=1 Tax=Phytophthora fragariaefolia TaxID=1490495 RepID=A0A9W7D493_9STRA|nr:unnamed protein product [Phytophthora fragariaefolia]
MDKSVTPRQSSLRHSSAQGKRSGGIAIGGPLTPRSRRISRLESALEDARTSPQHSPFCTPRLVRKQLPADKITTNKNNSTAGALQSVYDRVERRNNAHSDPSVQVSTLSTTQLQWAEQAVQTFVAEMRSVADNSDTQTKGDLAGALINDVIASVGITSSRTMPSVYTPRQQNHEVERMNQLDDVACWYAVGREIGRGTFGRVRFATHRLSGTPVAIKSYARLHGARSCIAVDTIGKRVIGDFGGDALEWRRVRQEVSVLSKLRAHPNIMRFVEGFETPTKIHAVTELVEGTNLCDVLRRAPGQQLPEAQAKGIFRQIAAGVESLHAQRVIHRDLKLENVLLDESSGHATVIDFGFSDLEEYPLLDPAGASKKIVKKKNFCGTPSYMAPEVVTSERYDGRPVDIWSLGVLLYVMLCGKFPFQGVSFHQLYQKLRSGSQQLVIPPALSAEARTLLQSLLIVDPAKRPSASELRCCLWLQTEKEPQCSTLQIKTSLKLSFETWPGTTEAIGSALAELYGIQQCLSDQGNIKTELHQCKRLGAFLKLATVASNRHFLDLFDVFSLSSLPSESNQSLPSESNQSLQNEKIAHLAFSKSASVEAPTQHKEQLEKLIALVKTSLATF